MFDELRNAFSDTSPSINEMKIPRPTPPSHGRVGGSGLVNGGKARTQVTGVGLAVVSAPVDKGIRGALQVGSAGQLGAVGVPVVVAAPQAHGSGDGGHEATGTRVTALSVLPLLHSATWYKYKGKPLVSIGAAKNHLALYIMSTRVAETHEDELKAYNASGGTVRFTPEAPLPPDLVRKLVQARIEENEANMKNK